MHLYDIIHFRNTFVESLFAIRGPDAVCLGRTALCTQAALGVG